MSALSHAVSIILAVLASYLWLHVPFLTTYSLQACAASILVYLFIKRLSKSKFWHLAPKMTSLEMPIVTFTILLLIGATGNTASLWFPLTFVHLFLLAMASENSTAITGTLAVILFHYAMSPVLSSGVIISLMNIPLVLFFYLFAKSQYHEAVKDELIIEHKDTQLNDEILTNTETTIFIQEVLLPKLAFMHELLEQPIENSESMRGQIMVMEEEALRAAQRLQNTTKKQPQTPL